MASLGSYIRSAARATYSAYRRVPVRWRLAGGSAALTLVILASFAAIVGVLTNRQVRTQFNDQQTAAADHLAGELKQRLRFDGTYFPQNARISLSDYAGADQAQPQCDLAALPPSSEEQQRAVAEVADRDGFNWGYDPLQVPFNSATKTLSFLGVRAAPVEIVLVVGAIVIALALSMLNVWTINPPQAVYNVDTARSGHLGSFTSGLMATLLATPCSAPYLGPVLAWALIQSTWLTALTLGSMFLALPLVAQMQPPGSSYGPSISARQATPAALAPLALLALPATTARALRARRSALLSALASS